MTSITTANGNPVSTEPACKAVRPPAINSAAATAPCKVTQNTRCTTGVFSSPPALMLSTTSEPESDEVTKNATITSTANADVTWAKGNLSSNAYNAVAIS